jgi:hypothetical protein
MRARRPEMFAIRAEAPCGKHVVQFSSCSEHTQDLGAAFRERHRSWATRSAAHRHPRAMCAPTTTEPVWAAYTTPLLATKAPHNILTASRHRRRSPRPGGNTCGTNGLGRVFSRRRYTRASTPPPRGRPPSLTPEHNQHYISLARRDGRGGTKLARNPAWRLRRAQEEHAHTHTTEPLAAPTAIVPPPRSAQPTQPARSKHLCALPRHIPHLTSPPNDRPARSSPYGVYLYNLYIYYQDIRQGRDATARAHRRAAPRVVSK